MAAVSTRAACLSLGFVPLFEALRKICQAAALVVTGFRKTLLCVMFVRGPRPQNQRHDFLLLQDELSCQERIEKQRNLPAASCHANYNAERLHGNSLQADFCRSLVCSWPHVMAPACLLSCCVHLQKFGRDQPSPSPSLFRENLNF